MAADFRGNITEHFGANSFSKTCPCTILLDVEQV